MNLRHIIDVRFPKFASNYRLLRDQWGARHTQTHRLPDGTEMIAYGPMAESRLDSGELGVFQTLLGTADVFVDVGANCGLFTLVARKAGVKTIAIEPGSESRAVLLLNLRKMELDDVEVFPIAIHSSVGVMPLFGGFEGASLQRNWGGMLNTYSSLVPVNSLDNLFAGRFCGQRLLIKADVEGHEFHLLQGAVKLLERSPSVTWMIEHSFSENFSGKINPHFLEVFEMFWSRGYSCCTADSELRPVRRSDVTAWLAAGSRGFGYLNYLFRRTALKT